MYLVPNNLQQFQIAYFLIFYRNTTGVFFFNQRIICNNVYIFHNIFSLEPLYNKAFFTLKKTEWKEQTTVPTYPVHNLRVSPQNEDCSFGAFASQSPV